MKKNRPDFSIEWRDDSFTFDSQIYCEEPQFNNDALLVEKMDSPLMLLDTPAACIAVTEISWSEPTTVSLVPDRPAFCLTISASPNMTIRYGYDDDTNLKAETGNIIFIVPGKKLTGHGSQGSFRTVMCSFNTEYAEALLGPLAELENADLTRALYIQNSLINSILIRLMKETLHPSEQPEKLVEACVNAMLLEFSSWLNANKAIPQAEGSKGKLTKQQLSIIEDYLSRINGKLPTVEELAAACGLGVRTFQNLFRESKKCSVAEYIRSAQIATAKTYLLDTDLPIKEIAYRLGFSSPANFTTAIRTATGKTPGQIRKTQQ